MTQATALSLLQQYNNETDEDEDEEKYNGSRHIEYSLFHEGSKRQKCQECERVREKATNVSRQEEVSDKGSVSCDKKRTFAHVEGNYPTHVYIDVKMSHYTLLCLNDSVQRLCDEMPSLRKMKENDSSDVGTIGWHLSLSRTIPTRRIQHHSLLNMLKKLIRKIPGVILPSSLTFDVCRPIVLLNDERTRTFLALRVCSSQINEQKLTTLVKVVDKVFVQHGLPKYYVNPIYHLSIAWTLGDQKLALDNLVSKCWPTVTLFNEGCRLAIGSLICRIGCVDNTLAST